jgi:hypothetical protein
VAVREGHHPEQREHDRGDDTENKRLRLHVAVVLSFSGGHRKLCDEVHPDSVS